MKTSIRISVPSRSFHSTTGTKHAIRNLEIEGLYLIYLSYGEKTKKEEP